MSGDWSFELVVPEHWISVDLERLPADRRHDLVDAVDQLVKDAPDLHEDVNQLVDMAENVLTDAERQDALTAAVGFDLLDGVVVAYSVAAYGVPGKMPFDVDDLAVDLSTPHGLELTEREVEVVDLPTGRAVRVHAIAEAAPDEAGQFVVVEGVDHFIPVPGGTDMLLLIGSTPSVAIGDMLLPVFDEIAASVRFAET